jgi:hypothetical protein
MSQPSKFTHHGGHGQWPMLGFLWDIEWSCGAMSSDLAVDAMPTGDVMDKLGHQSSIELVACESITDREKFTNNKIDRKKLSGGDDLQHFPNLVLMVRCFDKPDLSWPVLSLSKHRKTWPHHTQLFARATASFWHYHLLHVPGCHQRAPWWCGHNATTSSVTEPNALLGVVNIA